MQRELLADLHQHMSSSHGGSKTKDNLIWFNGYVNNVDDAVKKTAKPTTMNPVNALKGQKAKSGISSKNLDLIGCSFLNDLTSDLRDLCRDVTAVTWDLLEINEQPIIAKRFSNTHKKCSGKYSLTPIR